MPPVSSAGSSRVRLRTLSNAQIPRYQPLTPTPSPGEIPAMKLYESSKTLAFLDIQPLSTGHAVRPLIIPSAPAPPITSLHSTGPLSPH